MSDLHDDDPRLVPDVTIAATAIALSRPDLAYKGGGHRAWKALDAILNELVAPGDEWGEFIVASASRGLDVLYHINVRPGEEACQCEQAEWGGSKAAPFCWHIVAGWIMMATTCEYGPPIPAPKVEAAPLTTEPDEWLAAEAERFWG